MITNTLILVPFNNPLDWPADYLLQTCSTLSSHGNRVFAFLWEDARSLREILSLLVFRKRRFRLLHRKDNVLFFTPIHFLPFRRFRIVRTVNLFVNVFLMKLFFFLFFRAHKRILWVFSPEFYQLPKFFGRSFLSLYDCVDYFSSPKRSLHKRLRVQEERLVQACDTMVVNSRALFEKFTKKRSHIAVVPLGFALPLFPSFKKIGRSSLPFPVDKPIIGYVGGINYRLDFRLLNELVEYSDDYYFVFIGSKESEREDSYAETKGQFEKLFSHHYVFWVDSLPKEKIPAFIDYFDVALIPYSIHLEFNRYCYPMKLFEYFYLQKPVVATPIQELTRLQPLVRIGSNATAFRQHIQHILKGGWPKELQRRQRRLAIDNSWEKKIEAISTVLEQHPIFQELV